MIVWNDVVEAQREPLLKSKLLAVQGVWQRDTASGGQVRHLLAQRFKDLTPWLGRPRRRAAQPGLSLKEMP